MTNSCKTVTPSEESLTFWQELGLQLVSYVGRGRDIVLAIDLTESVGRNEEGALRLNQIIDDSLARNDRVFVVPFASTVNPSQPENNLITLDQAVIYKGKYEDIQAIQQQVPPEETSFRNTDIQKAESFIYNELAQLNFCRLQQNRPIRPQSVVWITDAPIHTAPGISSDDWIETPENSPFRNAVTEESILRAQWLELLPWARRTLKILNPDGESYSLTVVDIEPTVQEFCTPAPGARETCLVNSYIFGQLGPYILFLLLVSGLAVFAFRQWSSWKKKWQLYVEYESDDNSDDKICYLSSGQRIVIGDDGPNSINCPGHSIRGYIYRKGNNIFLDPASASFEADEILYKQELVTERVYIDSTNIRLQAPVKGQNQNFEIKITVQR